MPSQTFDLEQPTGVFTNSIIWSNPTAIDTDLVDGGATAYLTYVAIDVFGADRITVRTNTSATDSGASDPGPDLSDNFESTGKLIFRTGSHEFAAQIPTDLEVESNEPYSWGGPATDIPGLAEYVAAIRALPVGSRGTTLTLRVLTPLPSGTTVLWTGYIDDYHPIEERGGNDTMEVSAIGALETTTSRDVSAPVRNDISTADAALEILEEAGIPADDIGTLAGDIEMGRWWSPEQKAIDALREIEETEAGFLHEERTGGIALEAENTRFIAGDPIAVFTDDLSVTESIPVVPVIGTTPESPSKDIVNVVRVPVRQYSVSAIAVLWELANSVAIAADSSLVLVAEYPAADTPSGHIGVDEWVTPAAGTDYTAQTNLTVTSEPTAIGLRLTLENTGSSELTVTSFQARGAALVETNAVIVEVIDSDSRDNYGPRNYPVPSQFLATVDGANDYAAILLGRHAEPQRRAKVTWNANGIFDTLESLDLSSRVCYVNRGAREDMFIESIEHVITEGRRHDVTMQLAPAASFGNVIILDVGPPFDEGVLAR